MRLINGQPIDVVAGRRSARRPGGISAPGAEGWGGDAGSQPKPEAVEVRRGIQV